MELTMRRHWADRNDICLDLLFLLACERIFNQYYYWVICLSITVLILIKMRGRIIINKMPGNFSFLLFFIIQFVGGIYEVMGGSVATWPFFRDVIRITLIPIYWYISCYYLDKHDFSRKKIFSTIFFFVGVYSLVSITIRILNYISQGAVGFNAFVSSGAIDQYSLAIGLFIGFFKPSFIDKYYISKRMDIIIKCILLVATLLSFSRTLIIIFLCLVLINGFGNMKSIVLVLITATLITIVISYLIPSVYSVFFEKIENSFTEVSSNNTNWSNTDIVYNWRGYEIYCAKEQYSTYTIIEKIFGKGFGIGINAKGYAFLVTGEDELAFLHNGYYTSLVKGGITCLLLSITYHIGVLTYKFKHNELKYEKRFILGLGLIMAVSMFFINGVLWGSASLTLYILLCLFSTPDRSDVSN